METGTNNRLAVFWLFVMFAESQIKASERDPEYCKTGCETLFFGEPVIQAAELEKDCNRFTVCVAIGNACPRSMGNNSPVFFLSFRNRSCNSVRAAGRFSRGDPPRLPGRRYGDRRDSLTGPGARSMAE